MFRSFNASRASISRTLSRQSINQSRTFLATPSRKADLVQDLYVKAINSHKPTQVKASDATGQVQQFKIPEAPQSPEEANLANDLKAYEDQVVEVEGASTPGETPVEEDWMVEEEDEEEGKSGGH